MQSARHDFLLMHESRWFDARLFLRHEARLPVVSQNVLSQNVLSQNIVFQNVVIQNVVSQYVNTTSV